MTDENSRVAVVEAGVHTLARETTRLRERFHDLANDVAVLKDNSEQALEQRSEILSKSEHMAQQLNSLQTTVLIHTSEITRHVAACDKRGARMERIVIALLLISLSLVGYLLEFYISHH